MTNLENLDRPAAIVGLFRALFLFLVAVGVTITVPQQETALVLIAALIPIISLAFTKITTMLTVTKNPTTMNPDLLQVPPPGTVLVLTKAAAEPKPVPTGAVIAGPTPPTP